MAVKTKPHPRAAAPPSPAAETDYPESDGKPMGETERHVLQLAGLLECLRLFLADVPDVYVGGNMLIYYVPGNKRRYVVPDLFVVRGLPQQERREFR